MSRRERSKSLGELVCGILGSGDAGDSSEPKYFPYRPSEYITEYFAELGTDRVHDGPAQPPESFSRLIDCLVSPAEALNEGSDRRNVLRQLNRVLAREGFGAFCTEDGHCYFRHLGTNTVSSLAANPHRRPFTAAEVRRRAGLAACLDKCSEDELIRKCCFRCSGSLGAWQAQPVRHRVRPR